MNIMPNIKLRVRKNACGIILAGSIFSCGLKPGPSPFVKVLHEIIVCKTSLLTTEAHHTKLTKLSYCKFTTFLVRPVLLFSLFLVPRARRFFRKYQKKKKIPSKSTKLLPARARSHSPLLALHDDWKPKSRRESRESHFQVVAWTTKIVKGSFFKLQSSWGRSINTEKDGLRDPLVCVGIFQAVDVRVNARSSTKAGPIDDHSDFAPFAASSANTRESMEVELAIKWSCQQGFFFAARVLGKVSWLKALQRRETRRGRGKRHMLSVEWVLLRRSVRRHCKENVLSKKGTDVYQEQENFWRDWKLHNNIIDLLSSDKVGFRTDGSEMSADYWTRKGAR